VTKPTIVRVVMKVAIEMRCAPLLTRDAARGKTTKAGSKVTVPKEADISVARVARVSPKNILIVF